MSLHAFVTSRSALLRTAAVALSVVLLQSSAARADTITGEFSLNENAFDGDVPPAGSTAIQGFDSIFAGSGDYDNAQIPGG